MGRIFDPKEAKAYLERLPEMLRPSGSILARVVIHFLLSAPTCSGLAHSLEHGRSEPNRNQMPCGGVFNSPSPPG
jgi:hypothetical protein